jgi:hypothetical protein
MGWLYMQSLGGFKSPKAYLDNQFTHESVGSTKCEVLKSALVGMRTYYAAVKITPLIGTPEVFAVVCLVRYNKRAADGYIFGYKDMDETMGPCEAQCPQAILELLTPTESEYAVQWRERCKARLAKEKAKVGDTIVFEAPIRFTDGSLHSVFKLHAPWRKGGRPMLWAVGNGGGFYRISGWKERNFRIVGVNDETL